MYVGKSYLPDGLGQRMEDHYAKPWGWLIDADRTTVQLFDTEQEALAAEWDAITTERPLFNQQGSGGRGAAALQVLKARLGA